MSDIYEVRATWKDPENGDIEEWVDTYCATQKIAQAYIHSKEKARKSIPDQYLPSHEEPTLTIHKVDSVLTTEPNHLPVYYTLRNEDNDSFNDLTYALVNTNDDDPAHILLPSPIADVLIKAANKKGSLKVTQLEDEHQVEKTLFASSNHALLGEIIRAEG